MCSRCDLSIWCRFTVGFTQVVQRECPVLVPPAPKTSGCASPVSAFHAGTAVLLWAWLYAWLNTSGRIKEGI